MATTFDTLKASRKLKAVGFDEEKAEAIAETILAGRTELVTKDYLEAALWRVAAIQTGVTVGLVVTLLKLL